MNWDTGQRDQEAEGVGAGPELAVAVGSWQLVKGDLQGINILHGI